MIKNKQELKHFLRHSVRKLPVVETDSALAMRSRAFSLEEVKKDSQKYFPDAEDSVLGFSEERISFLSGAQKMGIPCGTYGEFLQAISEYTAEAFTRKLLDELHAEAVFQEILPGETSVMPEDDRIRCMLSFPEDYFPRKREERFGAEYRKIYDEILDYARNTDAIGVILKKYDPEAVKNCLIPFCEDSGCFLQTAAQDETQIRKILSDFKEHPDIKVLLQIPASAENLEILRNASLPDIYPVFCSMDYKVLLNACPAACIPFTSRETNPLCMLGKWQLFRERFADSLIERYTESARIGCTLEQEQIEKDLKTLFTFQFNQSDRDFENKGENQNESDF